MVSCPAWVTWRGSIRGRTRILISLSGDGEAGGGEADRREIFLFFGGIADSIQREKQLSQSHGWARYYLGALDLPKGMKEYEQTVETVGCERTGRENN